MQEDVMAQAVAGFHGASKAVNQLKEAAANGGFTVTDEGGQALINVLQEMKSKVELRLAQAYQLAAEMPLGTTPAAKLYKPFFASVASDPDQGFIPMLVKFKQDLLDASDTIKKSMASYQENEQLIADSLQGKTELA